MIAQFIKFCVVGGSGVLVDFSVTYALKEWARWNKYVANSCGFAVAATTNYILNRLWTFHSTDPRIARQYLIFVLIALAGLAINNAIIWLLTDKLKINVPLTEKQRFYLAKLIAIGVVTLWNFFMNYAFNF
ncbi:MAG: GtrA family protein [Rikenellaceae bacterium]|nr:GtrA family protein [Rikenellaceae bacterium]